MRETAVLFGSARSLVGIMTPPPETTKARDLPAAILLNSGLIHRVGPNRLYVNLARLLATLGFPVLRFDFSGIGDSQVREDHLAFEKSAISETQEAMDYLHAVAGSRQFILMGICSGANASFHTACRDPRVVGAVLINARGHLHGTNEELAAALRSRTLLHHYRRMAFSSSFRAKNWAKLLSGSVDYLTFFRAIRGFRFTRLLAHRRVAAEVQQALTDMHALRERGMHLLHIYSEADEGLDYLYILLGHDTVGQLHADGQRQLEIIPGANHTFTLLWSQEHLLAVVRRWMRETWSPGASSTSE
jgi:pimeloyl-ACP methyl ester carboxylesterase